MPELKTIDPKDVPPVFRGALEFAAAQADRILKAYPDYTPMYTVAASGTAKANAGRIGAKASFQASSGCSTATRRTRSGSPPLAS